MRQHRNAAVHNFEVDARTIARASGPELNRLQRGGGGGKNGSGKDTLAEEISTMRLGIAGIQEVLWNNDSRMENFLSTLRRLQEKEMFIEGKFL